MEYSKITGPYTERSDLVRTRSGAGQKPVETVYKDFNTISSYVWETTGVRTPGFKRKKGKVLVPHTPFSSVSKKVKLTSSTYSLISPTGNQYEAPEYGDERAISHALEHCKKLVSDVPPADAYIQKAAADIFAQGWDGLTFFAELDGIRSMFDDLIKKIRTGKPPRDPKDYAEYWLGYRYGSRTLAFDFVDIDKAINEFDAKRRFYDSRKGRTERVSDTFEDTSLIGVTLTSVADVSRSVRGSVGALFKPPRVRFDPVITAWEKVRFSFIVDWLIGVNDWLQAMHLEVYAQDLTASAGYSVGGQIVTTLDWIPSGDWGGVQSCTFTTSLDSRVRVPMSVPKIPQIRLEFDRYKALDLLALLLSGDKTKWRH